ncbi:unnamed protein product [Rhizophagus irregularis]|nr:unnamed protein product [Rhizophagus irregularis]
MSSELESLKQRITELEAKNDKLEAENVEIGELSKENAELRKENTDLRMEFANFEAERAELKRRIAETLRMTEEERTRRVAENAKLKARIEELESEFRDRITKVEQKQVLNDNSSNDNTPNNNSSNFNSGAVVHEKPPEKKEMDNFLVEANKKIVSDGIRQRNREKKLKKAEQASLNQDQESDSVLTVDNHTSSTSSEKSMSEKDGKRLIQEISRNLDSPEISFTLDKGNHVTEISFTSGIDKIQCITIYSANSISKLSKEELQEVINTFSDDTDSNCLVPEGPLRQQTSEISFTSDKENHVTEISETGESEVNALSISVSNSSSERQAERKLPDIKMSISITSQTSVPSTSPSRLPISILPDDSEEKRKYIIRLVLERFPSLYFIDSSRRGERFNLNSSTLYPLCNGDHKEESLWNDIRGEWGDGEYCREETYHIKCKHPCNCRTPIVSVKA